MSNKGFAEDAKSYGVNCTLDISAKEKYFKERKSWLDDMKFNLALQLYALVKAYYPL